MSIELDKLNEKQKKAVTCEFKPLLILAGAGSGKTRVIVHRVAWMIEKGVQPANILAVTFTNKAAKEMKERLNEMLDIDLSRMWLGTFHGMAHKLLRLHWQHAGLNSTFQIIDADDQLKLIKKIYKKLSISEDEIEPKKVQGFINNNKNEGVRADKVSLKQSYYDSYYIKVYQEYEKECIQNNIVDFNELLLRSYELLRDNPELLEHYQNRFSHVLVDEFQDTNTIQYNWLSLLAVKSKSITVVGDDDQSIYGWRGARVENIGKFKADFLGTEVVKLEQNYRSTDTILKSANALIANNNDRVGKELWTNSSKGELLQIYSALTEEDEALYITSAIKKWIEQGKNLSEVAILYRSNAQSRVLEEALVRTGIPYNIYGGLRFFERSEVKDALAYLRLIENKDDNTSFERVINVPPRGVGAKSFEKIVDIADSEDLSLWEASKFALETNVLSGKARTGVQGFLGLIEELDANNPLLLLVDDVIKKSGLLDYLREQSNERSQSRADNLEELVNATKDFELEYMAEMDVSPVTAFLSYVTLDAGEKGNLQDTVNMMTLHSAKGLEFDLVFIAGVEEGLFPHTFSSKIPKKLEEERRLCYVGITRAKQELHLLYAKTRRMYGSVEYRSASRFIMEIPEKYLNHITENSLTVRKPGVEFLEEEVLSVGARIKHAKFGLGEILSIDGEGDKAKIEIKFDRYGTKWLFLNYAKLEVL